SFCMRSPIISKTRGSPSFLKKLFLANLVATKKSHNFAAQNTTEDRFGRLQPLKNNAKTRTAQRQHVAKETDALAPHRMHSS
ncbi:MAG: hypothetical protein KIG35_04310, partial [Prevotellamassilia sp.]|nr:hypothetical protein [Prevotellamassilia sp.]